MVVDDVSSRETLDAITKAGFHDNEVLLSTRTDTVPAPRVLSRRVVHVLWDTLSLAKEHYDNALLMLGNAGVVSVFLKEDGENESWVAVVPSRLPSEPDDGAWPPLGVGRVSEYQLVITFPSGCPPGVAERFAAFAHRFGVTEQAWRVGAVVRNKSPRYRLLAGVLNPNVRLSIESRLVFTVRTGRENS